jgi:hypothetical protein
VLAIGIIYLSGSRPQTDLTGVVNFQGVWKILTFAGP